MTDPRSAYRESAARGASAVGQVALLYEQMVEDLRRAVRAIEDNRIEDRTNAINHALVVVGHLQGNLNFEVGGDVARNLERFYVMLRAKLVEAQFQASKEILNEQIIFLLDLHDAWIEVDRAISTPKPAAPQAAESAPEAGCRLTGEWNA